MAFQVPDEWQPHLQDIVSTPGVTVVIGAVDTGKTSFCALLANQALRAGVSTAVVDGDMGQSEIGPPTTVGLGIVESPIQALSDVEPRALCFIGTTSPVGHLLTSASGAKILVERAAELGRKLVIVDTTGLVRGLVARTLKTHKIELLRAKHIVALQKADEAEHFLRFFDAWRDCTIHRLPVSPAVRLKSQTLRAQRRAVRFREYFRGGQALDISLEQMPTSGTWLHTGSPLEPKSLTSASRALRSEVIHGELIGQMAGRPLGLYLVAKETYNRQGVEELKQEFGTSAVVVVPAAKYANLIVGLVDEHLNVLALGIVQKIDFRTRTAVVFAPLRSIQPVRAIRFGFLKLLPDGTEIGRIRPGEV